MFLPLFYTNFKHKNGKVCNINMQRYAFITLQGANIVFIYEHYIYSV